jgi:hypothetical protein
MLVMGIYFGALAKLTKTNKVSNFNIKFRVKNISYSVFQINEKTYSFEKEVYFRLNVVAD